jgi:hypothetical protein
MRMSVEVGELLYRLYRVHVGTYSYVERGLHHEDAHVGSKKQVRMSEHFFVRKRICIGFMHTLSLYICNQYDRSTIY